MAYNAGRLNALTRGDAGVGQHYRAVRNVLPEQGLQLKQHLLEIERSIIKKALGQAEGNVSKTARLLNLQRTTLIEKINKYGLSDSP